MAVEHIGLRSIRDADTGVPDWSSFGGIVGNEAAAGFARKQKVAARGEDSILYSVVSNSRIAMLPHPLAGLVVHGCDVAAHGAETEFILAAETHGSARICRGKVVHGVAVGGWDVHQPCPWAVSWRLPVRDALICRRHQCSGIVEVLGRDAYRSAVFIQSAGPVDGVGQLAGHQMLAGKTVQGKEVAIARGR